MAITYRMNAGRLPRSHWTHDADQGGRIVGEGCHVVDVFAALTRARVRVYATATESANVEVVGEDTASVVVTYDDGSVATLVYVANGSDRLAKEYCEVSAGGRTAMLRDFREVTFYEGRSSKRHVQGWQGPRRGGGAFPRRRRGPRGAGVHAGIAGRDDGRHVRRGRIDEDERRRRALIRPPCPSRRNQATISTPKIMRSSAFAVVGFGGTNVLSLVTTIILARLLTPSDFGLVALTVSLLAFTHLIQESGLGAALVVYRGNLGQAAASAAVFTPVVGVALYAVSYVAAPFLAGYPSRSRSSRACSGWPRWSSWSYADWRSSHWRWLERDMRYGPMTTIELAGGIAQAAVAIVLAVAGEGSGASSQRSLRPVSYSSSSPGR